MPRTTSLIAGCLTLAIASGWLFPALASAGLNPVVGDCYTNNRLTKHYSSAQLQQALNNIPADVAEYSNCSDVIRNQLNQELGHGGSKLTNSGSGSSSFLPVWLIVVIVLVVLGGGGATIAARRRSGDAP